MKRLPNFDITVKSLRDILKYNCVYLIDYIAMQCYIYIDGKNKTRIREKQNNQKKNKAKLIEPKRTKIENEKLKFQTRFSEIGLSDTCLFITC